MTALAGPAAAVDSRPANNQGHAFDFANDASYILDMRSAGIEAYTEIPAAIYPDIGYSEVQLTHDIGQQDGKCETDSGLYWAGQYLEEGVLGFGAAPPDAGSVQGGYHNPVYARDVKPNISAGQDLSARHPSLVNPAPGGQEITALPADGSPLLIKAACDSDVKGTAVGNVVDVAKTLDVVGSATEAEVNKATGEYTSTARAYVTGIQGAGNLDTVSSFMQVKQKPGGEPVVSYRLSMFDSDAGNSDTGFNQNGFTFSGSNIPADSLISQFNSQAKTFSSAASAIGPFGFTILAPKEGVVPSTEAGTTGLHFITAPAISAEGGSHLRDGTAGQEANPRFGSVTFTGVYGNQ